MDSSSPREVWVERMALLDRAAGKPPLKQVVTEAQRRGHPYLSISKWSSWRRGTAVPRRFAELRPVLGLLIARANGPAGVRLPHVDPAIFDMHAWERLHQAALATKAEPREVASTAAERPAPADAEAVCPYLGLAAFQEDDHARFFGRETATATLMARLNDAAAGGGITALVGDSGAGKSSLLRAGVVWAARNGELAPGGISTAPIVIMTPGEHPLDELTNHIPQLKEPLDELRQAHAHDEGDAEGGGDEVDRATFSVDAVAGIRGAVASYAAEVGEGGSRPLVIVDQAEELFTLCQDTDQQATFIGTLHAMCTASPSDTGDSAPPALVLFALRADFYIPFLGYPELRDALEARQILLGPMSKPELRDAITKPAEQAGLSLENPLISVLLHDMGVRVGRGRRGPAYDAGLLPLLSHALVATWMRRDRRDAKLTVEGYNAGGGIRGAVAATGERAWGQLDQTQQVAALDVLLKLTRIGEDTQDTRRRLTKPQLLAQTADPAAAEKALDVLTDARLVTQEAESIQITHEALLNEWPRLRSQIDADRAGHLLRQRIEDSAVDWANTALSKDKLYRGTILAEALEWAGEPEHRDQLSSVARTYLDASTQQEHKAATTRRRVLIGLGALTLTAIGGGVGAVVSAAEASRERDAAIFGQITTQANQLRTLDTSLAALLDLVAYRRRDTPELRTRLISSENDPISGPISHHQGAVNSSIWSKDGRFLATASDDTTIQLWEATPTGLEPRGQLLGHKEGVITVVFSPDGRTLASASADATMRLWDVTNPEQPHLIGEPLGGFGGNSISIAFSPDGRTLASGSSDRMVHLFDVSNINQARPLPPLVGHSGDVNGVAWSSDGLTLASGSDDGLIKFWDLSVPAQGRFVSQVLGHVGGVTPLDWSPDGRFLASGGADRAARLWDASNPRLVRELPTPISGHRGRLFMVRWSPDSRLLATSAVDRTVRLWNMTNPNSPASLGSPLYGHNNIVYAVGWHPSSRQLATGAEDRQIRVWNLPTALPHPSSIAAITVSPDRRLLASAGPDQGVQLWDITDTARPILTAQMPGTSNHAVAFHPAGHILASAGDDRLITLWDVSTPNRPRQLSVLPGHGDTVAVLAFRPDGRLLASAGNDKTVRLWDVSDPTHPVAAAPVLIHGSGTSQDPDQGGPVLAVGFSPDGRHLASGGDLTVVLWDVSDPDHPARGAVLPGHTRPINSVEWAPDGQTLASASNDQTIRLWNVADPAQATPAAVLNGHVDNVYAVAFSHDGHTLASGSSDQTVQLWDVTDPARPAQLGQGLTAHTDVVNAVAFSPTDFTLFSGSGDRTVRIWDVRPPVAIQRICTSTRGTLTEQVWDNYFPAVPYQPPCGARD